MVGRETKVLERKKQDYTFKDADTAVQMKNIHKGIRLSGVDIEIRRERLLVWRGCRFGRTELAQVLFGMNPPDAGEIFWWGERSRNSFSVRRYKKEWDSVRKTVR